VVPVVPTLAWYHGVRALKRVSGSELIIIALLLLIGGSLLWLVPRPTAERAKTETASPPTETSAKPDSTPEVFGLGVQLMSKVPNCGFRSIYHIDFIYLPYRRNRIAVDVE